MVAAGVPESEADPVARSAELILGHARTATGYDSLPDPVSRQ